MLIITLYSHSLIFAITIYSCFINSLSYSLFVISLLLSLRTYVISILIPCTSVSVKSGSFVEFVTSFSWPGRVSNGLLDLAISVPGWPSQKQGQGPFFLLELSLTHLWPKSRYVTYAVWLKKGRWGAETQSVTQLTALPQNLWVNVLADVVRTHLLLASALGSMKSTLPKQSYSISPHGLVAGSFIIFIRTKVYDLKMIALELWVVDAKM